MKTEKSIFKKTITGITMLLSVFFAFIDFDEFYKIEIRKETELYPFGAEGPVPYYYQTAELYAYVNLTYGITFGILVAIGIWNWRKNKINDFVMFGLTSLLIIIHIYHGWVKQKCVVVLHLYGRFFSPFCKLWGIKFTFI